MENSLSIAEKRRGDGGLLSGWNLYFTYNHANNKKVPKQEDLQLIVQAAGGTVLPQSDSPLSSEVNPQKVIVITSDSVLPEKISDSRAAKPVLDGARFFLMRWLFDCITNQELSKMNDIKSYSYYSGWKKTSAFKKFFLFTDKALLGSCRLTWQRRFECYFKAKGIYWSIIGRGSILCWVKMWSFHKIIGLVCTIFWGNLHASRVRNTFVCTSTFSFSN